MLPNLSTCPCCGSDRLCKVGEDTTETAEKIPAQYKVIVTVREKFSCRDCEKITQPPAPFHVIPRGFMGPQLLASIVFDKFLMHQPLARQSERFAHEGFDVSTSTLSDRVGSVVWVAQPIFHLIENYVLAAERLHADDTTVPILAKGKTVTGRLWTYVRDDRPFGGGPPAALFYASRDRGAEHPDKHLADWRGILQADAYGGYNHLFKPNRSPGAAIPAFCWAHARRGFFELADLASNKRRGKKATPISPLALEGLKRIDVIFALEREINGQSPETRLAFRQERIKPLVIELESWMKSERPRLSKSADPAKAMDYMLKRWQGFTSFLNDGRICLSNNAAERAVRGLALGRRNWLFAGSDRGAARAAVMNTLLITAKLNEIDPLAWMADVLARIAEHPISRLHELLPWEWKAAQAAATNV